MSVDDPFSPDERAVLEARGRALARPLAVDGRERDGIDLVVVRAARDRYGIPSSAVAAVATLTKLTPIPHAPAYVAGLTSFRGAIVVVFHLHGVLGAPAGIGEHGRIVVLEEGCAIAVDAIEGIEPLRRSELRPPPPSLGIAAASLIEGVTASGVAVLSRDELLSCERMSVDIAIVGAQTARVP